ncbi:DUF417 family protein [Vibrio sp. Sgm 5]|uniref:DUF417 family protein n=1 Tax=Vibrio sp. Sgm 5 TaxID=2994387 RepID=UPI003A4C5578
MKYDKMVITKTLALSIFVIWLGFLKFFPFEAELITPFVENSPLTNIPFSYFGANNFSMIVGFSEIMFSILLLFGLYNNKVGLIGSLGMNVTFLVTLSFIFTTPNVNKFVQGAFVTDFFLLKDVMFLLISIDLLQYHKKKIRTV